MAYTLKINGETRTVDADADTPLLWVLRDRLDLTGTKFGCGVASCGACTVQVDGYPTRSCQLAVEAAAGSEIVTIEGIMIDGIATPAARAVQDAWRRLDVVQCGYCQSGQIMAAIGLLAENPAPTDQDIDDWMGGNACRCATYARIRAAIHEAARTLEG